MRSDDETVNECVLDGTTLWVFREKLAQAGLVERLFERFDQHLSAKGYLARGGQTRVPAPSSAKRTFF